ncbi:MAG TPA: carboxypeptidase regulatory-like domain-containing protein [Bryobacteraceae bacterium]
MGRHGVFGFTWRVLFWGAAALFVVSSAFGQQAILGTVTDESGAVVPNAQVTLTNTATGIRSTTATSASGSYQFPDLAIGLYKVAAQKTGFATAVAPNVRLVVGARQQVNLKLQLGNTSQTVEVTAAAPLVATEMTSHGQVINSVQILQLPLNDRDPARLALLSTGVVVSAENVGDLSSGKREGAFNINGLRSDTNNYILDDVDNNEMGTSNQGYSYQVVQLSPDALAEYKVETNNFTAQEGRAGGAVIREVSKSGTNQFRGSLWEFNRNTDFDAAGFFAKPGAKPQLNRNQFGGTFGGPIIRNRAFFFADAEIFRQVTTSDDFSTIPTLDDRLGIFSVPVRNPLSGEIFPAKTPIPANALSPFAVKVLSYLPAPNEGNGGRANNLFTLAKNSQMAHHEDLRLDYSASNNLKLFARLSNRRALIYNGPGIPGLAGGNSNGHVHVFNKALATGATWILSPTSLLAFHFGFDTTQGGKVPVASGGPSMLALFGITGLPTDPKVTGGLTAQSISGFSQLGRQPTNPQFQNPLLYDPKVDYTLIRGSHTIQAGYEFQGIHTEVADLNTIYGEDTYSGQFSKLAGGNGPSATYNFADFLFGLRNQYQLETYYIPQMRQRMQFAYIQDAWKATAKLTLNYGLRYEYATPLWEANNKLSNFDPATNSIVLAKPGSMFDRSTIHPDYKDFAPRFGIAYALNQKTVIRSSYGIFYNHLARVGSGNILALNGPQMVQATIVQTPGEPGFRTTDEGYPAGLTDPSNFDPATSTMEALDMNKRASMVQQWFFGVQRQLDPNSVLDISYVGNHAVRLLMFVDENQALPNSPGENIPLNDRRFLYPGFSAISAGLPVGLSKYNALQAKFEHRWSGGLYFLDSFTWSHALDNSTLALENPNDTTAKPQNYFDLAAEYASSIYNMPLVNSMSLVWAIPAGRGHRFGAHMPAVLDGILGGWQISVIGSTHSGQPVNLEYEPSSAFQVSASLPTWLGGVQMRPNVTGPVQGANPSIHDYFLKQNIQIPTDPSQPFGSAGRNLGVAPGYVDFDAGIFKSFVLPYREAHLQFRAEFFNALNQTNFTAPNGDVSSASFGTITSTFDPRQIQLGLKLSF